jgi:hypothetical protein
MVNEVLDKTASLMMFLCCNTIAHRCACKAMQCLIDVETYGSTLASKSPSTPILYTNISLLEPTKLDISKYSLANCSLATHTVFCRHMCFRRPQLSTSPTRLNSGLPHLYDHLSNTMPSESLATHESLSLNTCQCIERCRDCQENRCSNQTRRRRDDDTEPLHNSHDQVDQRSHVIRGEPLHEGIKLRRGRADSEKQWDLDEDDDE